VTFRRTTAALLFAAIAFAVGLSAAPQLHEWLHKVDSRSTHECAATLMSSGSVEHSACEPPPTQRDEKPTGDTSWQQPLRFHLALLGVSLLEHAPPAQS
jgi:hypothetical protein